jgi:putative phage DNA-binding protein
MVVYMMNLFNEEEKKIFGENLKKIRKNCEMTQSKLAKEVGVSASIITKYERGLNAPNFDILFKLAMALDTSVDELIGNSLKKFEYIEMADEMTKKMNEKYATSWYKLKLLFQIFEIQYYQKAIEVKKNEQSLTTLEINNTDFTINPEIIIKDLNDYLFFLLLKYNKQNNNFYNNLKNNID